MAADACETILANLSQAGLLDSTQFNALVDWVRGTRPEPQALGKELLRRQWLTLYQLKEFQKGRAKQLFLGPYIVLDLLGEGGMGRVFKARHLRLGREVALKIIRREKLSNPVAISRFRQEIHAAGQLAHPNVVLAFDSEETEAGLFLSMEYVEGTDLTKYVRAHGPMGVPQACDAIRQAALGLQHAFERGMVHRDIKPSNLLYTPRGQVKVLDLGLAMLHAAEIPGGEDAHRVTQEGFVLGTPDFLAPEQAQNPMGVDIRADIYALGATLFYILSGKVPFEGANPTEKLLKHVTAPAPSVRVHRPDVPAQLDGVIRWMMAKLPNERPQTPAQVAMTLLPFCPPQSGAFPPPQPHGPVAMATPVQGFPQAPPAPAANFNSYAQPAAISQPMGQPPAMRQVPGAQPKPAPASYPHAVPAAYPQAVAGNYPHAVAVPVEEFANTGGAEAFSGFRADDPDEDEPAPRNLKGDDGEKPRKKAPADPDRIRTRDPKKRSMLPLYLIGAGVGVIGLIAIIAVIVSMFGNYARSNKPLEDEFDSFNGHTMKKIEPGEFSMGSPVGEEKRDPNEGPQDNVKITYHFYMATTEVTTSQYALVMNSSPADPFPVSQKVAGLMPVVNVSWNEATEYCRKLSLKEKNRRPGWSYRLPTEAEWEYCCRAGTSTPFFFGKTIMFQRDAVFLYDSEDAYGEENPELKENKIDRKPRPYHTPLKKIETAQDESVEKNFRRLPNKWGLFDMHGNVWEWCYDFYEDTYEGQRTDPFGPASAQGSWHTMRGGAWNTTAADCRSARRVGRGPTEKDIFTGFRVVFAPDREAKK
jgi:formylglycine-generating enzyme required for sulfatase activity/serine/threonine protein kinase